MLDCTAWNHQEFEALCVPVTEATMRHCTMKMRVEILRLLKNQEISEEVGRDNSMENFHHAR